MRFYPDLPARRLRSLVRDLLVIAALVAFALLGLWVHDLIDKLAVLGEGVRKVGSSIPFAGDPIENLGERGENDVHNFANMMGLLFFALPGAALLLWYLPRRLQQISALTAHRASSQAPIRVSSRCAPPSRCRTDGSWRTRATRSATSRPSITARSSTQRSRRSASPATTKRAPAAAGARSNA